MTPLRIHFYTSYVHEQGTYFRAHNLAMGLIRLGHDVTVFGCDVAVGAKARREERDGVRYDIVPESWKSSIFSQFSHPLTSLRRYCRSYPPCDVGHLFQPFLGAAAAWTRCPARVRFYDWDDQWTDGLISGPVRSWRDHWPRFITRRLEDRLPRRADHVTAISHYLAERARAKGSKQVTLIRSGAWPAVACSQAEARAAVGLRPEALYVGFMGYTVAELPWCIEALQQNLERYPRLRLALCGAPCPEVERLAALVRERIDHLGQLPAARARLFAAGLDLGLLPLAKNTFNRSRLPQKYGDHLVTGVPLLCSDVGECGKLNDRFGWVIRAGTTKEEWHRAFAGALARLAEGDRPNADLDCFAAEFSWDILCRQLAEAYATELSRSEVGSDIACLGTKA